MNSNWTLHHIGIPVRDLDKSLDDYGSLGIAEFGSEFAIDSSKNAGYKVYDKTPDPAVRTRGVIGSVGAIGVELLQPVQGHTVHKELLESVGEGVGHVAFTVDDIEAETEKMVERGFPVILSIIPPGSTRRITVYLDTRSKFSGLVIELMQAAT